MAVLFLLAVLVCAGTIAAGLLLPGLRPMAVSGGIALLFLAGLALWWVLLARNPAGP